MLIITSKGGDTFVAASESEGGVAYGKVSHAEGGVASASDHVKEVWSQCQS